MTTEIKLTDEQCDALGVERGVTLKRAQHTDLLFCSNPPKPKAKQWYPDYWLLTNEHKKHIRVTRTLLAYVAEFDDDWKADWDDLYQRKYFIYYNHRYKKWLFSHDVAVQSTGKVYMSDQCAISLLEKLKSGVVDLNG